MGHCYAAQKLSEHCCAAHTNFPLHSNVVILVRGHYLFFKETKGCSNFLISISVGTRAAPPGKVGVKKVGE